MKKYWVESEQKEGKNGNKWKNIKNMKFELQGKYDTLWT